MAQLPNSLLTSSGLPPELGRLFGVSGVGVGVAVSEGFSVGVGAGVADQGGAKVGVGDVTTGGVGTGVADGRTLKLSVLQLLLINSCPDRQTHALYSPPLLGVVR